ncbi:MAG: glutathione S-transferase N-terminal domain-containing protein [Alphaproteobacteria bacterium]
MKLIGGLGSPYVRKVRVVIAELGIIDQVELVPSAGQPGTLNQETSGVNPIGKIPALVMDNGQALYDSRMIMRYLNEKEGGSIYVAGDWELVRRESQAEGMLDAGLILRFETFARPEALRWDGWIEGQSLKVKQCLDSMEKDADALAQVDAASITTGCGLGYLDFRFPDWGWRDGRPALAAWYETFSQRESMATTGPTAPRPA